MRDGFRKKIKEEKKRGKEDGWMKRGRGKEKKKKGKVYQKFSILMIASLTIHFFSSNIT